MSTPQRVSRLSRRPIENVDFELSQVDDRVNVIASLYERLSRATTRASSQIRIENHQVWLPLREYHVGGGVEHDE